MVRVEFSNDPETWDTVIVESVDNDENPYVDEEKLETFVVEYETQDKFDRALNRFNGMVEYKLLS